MVNVVEFVLLLLLVIAIAVILAFLTGIIFNRKGYVSIIEKKKKFHCVEMRKFSYYLPLLFRKVAYYPTIKGKKRIDKKNYYYQVIDVMKLYNTHKKVKDIIKENHRNISKLENDYGIKLLSKN